MVMAMSIDFLFFIGIGFVVGTILGAILTHLLRPRDTSVELLKQQIAELRAENARMIGQVSATEAKIKTLENVRGEMMRDFKNVSAELLSETRKAATEEHTETLNRTINPFKEQMAQLKTDFDKQIKDMLKNSVDNRAQLEVQIKTMMDASGALKKEASDLTQALRGNKKILGNWGEIQVERLFELLDWQEGVQYESQKHVSGGRDIPDYIVHMPGNKHFVVDAKMSLNSYMDYLAAESDVDKKHFWKQFVDATKAHIKELGDKNYNKVVDRKFDYVCMFMPLEHAYIELMNRDKEDIYKYAFDNGVTIATPSLLLPMLRTIDTLMKVEKQSKNVGKIVEFAEKLYDKYAGFTEDYVKIGNALKTLDKNYKEGMGKLATGSGSMSSWFNKIKKQGGLSVTKILAIESDNVDGDDENE